MTTRIYPDLETFFHETKITQKEFARRLGIVEPVLSRIKNKLHQPSLDLALRIAREANIPLESLLTAENVERS